jgi:hypothetical protein
MIMGDMTGVNYDRELGNGWNPWQNLVLQGLKELRDGQEKIQHAAAEVATRVTVIETKLQVEDEDKKGFRLSWQWALMFGLTGVSSVAALVIAVVTVING